MLRSFAEDGEFARLALRGLEEHWIPKVAECLEAAAAAADAHEGPVRARSAGWFALHRVTRTFGSVRAMRSPTCKNPWISSTSTPSTVTKR